MRTNPFYDAWLFLIGQTEDHLALGPTRFLLVALYLGLLIASVWLAGKSWREDPSQRSATHLWTWLFRVLIGTMWFQSSLWKLPLPVSPGLVYWTEQMAEHAAFQFHKDLVRELYLPYMFILNPIVYLAETSFAISLILGFAVRLFSIGAVAFTLHLWLGLYLHPHEWPWLYIFLVVVQGFFVIHAAGRSLGADAILHRKAVGPFAGKSALAHVYRLAS
jgi:uncharacterized membrane protein YphA (DoxX/SURF4 family)